MRGLVYHSGIGWLRLSSEPSASRDCTLRKNKSVEVEAGSARSVGL
jgi:hypothetical protein